MPEERDEELGPWIEHDGQGCPADLIGCVVLIEFQLSHNDRDGGRAGERHFVEVLVNEAYAGIPEWWRERFGEIAENPITGELYGVADIIRYRIRRSSAFKSLLRTAELPDKVNSTETIEA